MKYYKDKDNQVYAYESDGSQDAYIKDGLVAITEEEMRELTKPSKEQITESNKSKIQYLIQESTLQIDILKDTIELEIQKDGDEKKLTAWKHYRVLLTRVDTSVENMELPKKPE